MDGVEGDAPNPAAGPARHVPVLLEEVLEGLGVRDGGVYLDGTLGDGGHAEAILSRFAGARVVGLDRDPEAVERSRRRLSSFGDRASLLCSDYRRLGDALASIGQGPVDGILLDLGISSAQLADPARGFSFLLDGPLDMRMDQRGGRSAADLVNGLGEGELAAILRDFGEERLARRVASAIVRERGRSPIRTTHRLAAVVAGVPGMGRVWAIHPATRTFQALRIAVNDELGGLREGLAQALDALRDGGRLAVIAFHSLEDRIVKRAYRAWEHPCRCPREAPACVCGERPRGRAVARKAVRPTEAEVDANPRSRSARLRVFEKVEALSP